MLYIHTYLYACIQAGQCDIAAGMAEMASELYKQLEPHIKRARASGQTICFGGHSLGGALATLVCCLAHLHLKLPASQVQCATFGSPPVLAHTHGKSGDAILQVSPACIPVMLLSLLCCTRGQLSALMLTVFVALCCLDHAHRVMLVHCFQLLGV